MLMTLHMMGTDPAHVGTGPAEMMGTGPAEMDIVFRAAAKAGDVLVSECFREEGRTLHLIRRPADGLVLASSAMVWA